MMAVSTDSVCVIPGATSWMRPVNAEEVKKKNDDFLFFDGNYGNLLASTRVQSWCYTCTCLICQMTVNKYEAKMDLYLD